jgi:hypothetical protein
MAPFPGPATHRLPLRQRHLDPSQRGDGSHPSPLRRLLRSRRAAWRAGNDPSAVRHGVVRVLRTARPGTNPASLRAASTVAAWPDAHPAQGDEGHEHPGGAECAIGDAGVGSPSPIYTDLGTPNGTSLDHKARNWVFERLEGAACRGWAGVRAPAPLAHGASHRGRGFFGPAARPVARGTGSFI